MAWVFLFTGCDKNRIYEENKEIPDGVWDRSNKIKFSVQINDTVNAHNIYANLRNSGEYPYRNIYLFITTSSKGVTAKDTLECMLADEKGKWYGSGLGDIFDYRVLYKKNVKFPHSGIFTFEFEQAMRMEKLPHIADIGLRIEKAK
ncbi:MAG: gliding motility lipoprotein GldH [Bacteroidia bacterium]|nr:gliding motility lipoprotein GldH [Bacteroidia bacterium]